MQLKAFLKGLSAPERAVFLRDLAAASGTTVGNVQNVAYGTRRASAALAMQAELMTGGAVTRAELRPDDAHLIWTPKRPGAEPMRGDAAM